MLTGSLMVRHEACMPCDHNHEVMRAELRVVLHGCCSYAQKRCRALRDVHAHRVDVLPP